MGTADLGINNGYGNGDRTAPGNSLQNNNAEMLEVDAPARQFQQQLMPRTRRGRGRWRVRGDLITAAAGRTAGSVSMRWHLKGS
jgi:hypothetical protein